jgi:hemerythrin-like metal-binding protein
MPLMEWTDALDLGVELMDATHREFAALLNELAEAPDDQMLARFDAFYAHSVAHFEQEDRWMAAIDFPATHCHRAEHEGVLDVMREVRGYLSDGGFHVGRVLATELAEWFRGHLATMDTMLAQYMRAKQYRAEAVAPCAHGHE